MIEDDPPLKSGRVPKPRIIGGMAAACVAIIGLAAFVGHQGQPANSSPILVEVDPLRRRLETGPLSRWPKDLAQQSSTIWLAAKRPSRLSIRTSGSRAAIQVRGTSLSDHGRVARYP